MPITGLHLERFTVFEDARFDFASGLNVLVGENGTGKTHVLKALWALHRDPDPHGAERGIFEASGEQYALGMALAGALGAPSAHDGIRLGPMSDASLRMDIDGGDATILDLERRAGSRPLTGGAFRTNVHRGAATYLPSREVLSLLPGFVASWDKRESSFDRTYRELCAELTVPPLRTLSAPQEALLGPLEASIGGKLIQNGERFTIETAAGAVPIPMVGEGLRKIAQLIQLVRNGTLEPGGILLWDEPEASLSPKLAHTLAMTIVGLVRLGLQVFVSTHDYVLASELSLEVNRPPTAETKAVDAAFFGLSRVDQGPVTVERADAFEALQTNPILDAFSALHHREARAREDGAS